MYREYRSGTRTLFADIIRRNTDIVERGQSKHYSTFYLYESQEFERFLAEFRKDIRESYEYPDKINWSDEKTMHAVLRKQPR